MIIMKFAHAFWSKPLFENKFNNFSISLANTLYDYAYSVECIHKAGYKITLYADKCGIELLNLIPYDSFVEIPIDDNFNKHFAASIKFYALQKMDIDDVLIDGDVMLELPNVFNVLKLNRADMLYSFFENNKTLKINPTNEEYFGKLLNLLRNAGLDYEMPTYDTVEYPNTSLIKFNNEDFKNEYIEQYFRNIDKIKDVDFGFTWPDIIIEQYFLQCLANKHNYLIKGLIDNYPEGTKYTKKLGFTHFGNQKTQVLPKVKNKLNRLNSLLKRKIDIYYKNILENFKDIE